MIDLLCFFMPLCVGLFWGYVIGFGRGDRYAVKKMLENFDCYYTGPKKKP